MIFGSQQRDCGSGVQVDLLGHLVWGPCVLALLQLGGKPILFSHKLNGIGFARGKCAVALEITPLEQRVIAGQATGRCTSASDFQRYKHSE